MRVNVLREFNAGGDTYPAGQSADLEDAVAERVIKAGWAEMGQQEWPKKLGGGYYELSDGTKVRGREASEKAQSELDDGTAADGGAGNDNDDGDDNDSMVE